MCPRLAAATTTLALLAGCSGVTGRRREGIPDRVDIELVDVVVSPVRADGGAWDGAAPAAAPFGREFFHDVAATVPAPGSPWVPGWGGTGGRERPDPHGWAEIAVASGWLSDSARRWPGEGDGFLVDTLAAQFSAVEWRGVVFAPGTRLRVTVFDRDYPGDEMMGVAEVAYPALVRAYEVGGVVQVPVGDQTDGQVVSLGIAVKPARR
jgi:hypothetical protein